LTTNYTDRYRYFMAGTVPRGQARQRLLQTAAALFYARGIHAVGVDAIADHAGVTKRTLYQHFPSKDALIAEALADRGTTWRAWFAAELRRRAHDPAGQLLAMFDVIGQGAATADFRGCRFVNAAAELPDVTHPARAVASAHKHAVLDLITALVAELDVAEPETLARQLKLLLEGAIATALVDPGPQPARDARTAAATLLDTHTRHRPSRPPHSPGQEDQPA
jgi:AcrR family transcriptional regulator